MDPTGPAACAGATRETAMLQSDPERDAGPTGPAACAGALCSSHLGAPSGAGGAGVKGPSLAAGAGDILLASAASLILF